MEFLKRLNQIEPARVRAVWVAVLSLLAALGVVVSTDFDAAVNSAIVIVFTLLPLIQGEATRRAVYAPATVDNIVEGVEAADEDLIQESTGNGYDPDQTWDDEPPRDGDELDNPKDRHDGDPIEEA